MTRGSAILRLLARGDAPPGVQATARAGAVAVQLPAHQRAPTAEELVAFDPATSRHGLASGAVTLARAVLTHDALGQLARPVLNRLAARRGATAVGVEVASLDHIVVAALARPDAALQLRVDVGSRYPPALISATGRCIAASGGHPPGAMEARFGGLRWDNPPPLARWRADVEATRRAGFAADEGRYTAGVIPPSWAC